MKITKLLILFSLLVYFSCQPTVDHLGVAKDYLPAPVHLKKGVVNKYYNHVTRKKGQGIITDMFYRSYRLSDNGDLENHSYYPDYKPSAFRIFRFENDQMILDTETQFNRWNDTFQLDIHKPILRNFAGQESTLEKEINNEHGVSKWIAHQQTMRDTVVMDRPAKIFEGVEDFSFTNESDTSRTHRQFKDVYVQGIGLYSRVLKDTNITYNIELVEQLSMDEFNRKSEHGLHRVAYIDPDSAMDKETPFQTCDEYIYDYYNGEQKLHYNGGKKAIWEVVNKRLNKKKLLKESGYLTFRFVINCKGTMGRITTEQAGLDFQPKKFSYITVNHFYKIAQEVDDWIPTNIRGENVDAYFYLTFKLKNGELIELLP